MNSERLRRPGTGPARPSYAPQPTILASKVRRLAGPERAWLRSRLLPGPNELTATRLFLLKALAGYGKTTLLRQYGRLAEDAGMETAWLRLDTADNEPMKALGYLVAAFAEIDPQLGSEMGVFLSALPPLATTDILAELIARLQRRDAELLLLVDDYQAVSDPQVHGLFAYFLQNLPSNVRVAMATRHLPPWDLDALAPGAPVKVLDETDIRFRIDEVADYLLALHGLRLEFDDLNAVHRQTDGWISAIKLVSHALERRNGRVAPALMDANAQRGLIDYLASSVFDRLDAETQEFLLLTAPLERLCPSLCDAVTGANNARAMLDRLVAENLFIEPLDAVGGWHRYHSLFSEFLLARLAARTDIDRSALHRRASFWFEVNRQPHAAAEHAMAAGDALRQQALIEAAILSLVRDSRIALAMSWFDTLPPAFSENKPDVLIPMAWCNIYLQRAEAAADLLRRARRALEQGPELLSEADRLRRNEYLVEVEFAELDLQRNTRGFLPDARQLQAARDRVAPDWHFLRAYIEFLHCHAYTSEDRLDAAFAAASEAVVYAKRVPNAFVANLALEQLAKIRFLQGRLAEARALCEDAIGRAYGATGEPLPVVAHFHLLLSKLHFESNDIEKSRQHLAAARHLTQPSKNPEMVSEIEILAAAHLARGGDPACAASALIDYNNRGLDLGSPDALRRVRAHQVWFHVGAGQLRAAEGVLTQAGAPIGRTGPPASLQVSAATEYQHLALCRFLIASERVDAAVNWLRHLLRLAERSGRLRSCIMIHGLLAIAQAKREQPEAALRHVREMTALGEAGGFARTLIDVGDDLLPLLREYEAKLAESAEPRRAYVRQLLAIARGAAAMPPGPSAARPPLDAPPAAGDIEALTPREVQILEMISEGRRNREVADELLIAESSVRWHVRNLFSKLGVHNRTEASAKGRSLRLIH